MGLISVDTGATAANDAAAAAAAAPGIHQKPKVPEVPMLRLVRGADKIYGDYNTIDDAEGESAKTAKMEMWMAKGIGTKLAEAYPNRQWGVQVDIPGGVVVISNPYLSKEKGYVLHIQRETLQDLSLRAVKAAGEILERFGITRGRKFDEDIIETLDRNIKDDVIAPDA